MEGISKEVIFEKKEHRTMKIYDKNRASFAEAIPRAKAVRPEPAESLPGTKFKPGQQVRSQSSEAERR